MDTASLPRYRLTVGLLGNVDTFGEVCGCGYSFARATRIQRQRLKPDP